MLQNRLEELSDGKFYYFKDTPFMKVGDEAFELSSEAYDTLLSFLKIPRKYLYRLADGNREYAADNVNHWLEHASNIGGMVEGTSIVKVYDSRKLFVPIQFIVNSLQQYYGADNIFGYYDGDIYVCTIPVKNTDVELANGDKGFISIRLMFSECFQIAPRVDSVLTIKGSYENYYYPIQGRKFRVAENTPGQVDELIREFGDVVVIQMAKQFVPRLNEMIEMGAMLPSDAYIGRLCSELRISRKIGQYLLAEVGNEVMPLHDLVRKIGNAVMSEVRPSFISLDLSREIELAISRSIVKGSFK